MAQQQATKEEKKLNCTYDSLYGFVKQASVWVAGAVWLKKRKQQPQGKKQNKTKKNTAIFKKHPHFDQPKFERLKTKPRIVLLAESRDQWLHQAQGGQDRIHPIATRGRVRRHPLPQSTFWRHCGYSLATTHSKWRPRSQRRSGVS